MSTQVKEIIGYMISVDKLNWLKISPYEYFYTKEVAVVYGKQNFLTMMSNCDLVHTPGNPAILYVVPVVALKNKESMPFTYDLQKPLTPKECAEIKHMTEMFKYQENLIKQQNPSTTTDFEKILQDETLRIRKRYQQKNQSPIFTSLGKVEEILFELGD